MISDAEGAPAPDVPVVSEVPASVTSTDPLPVDVPPMTPEIGSGTPPPPADVVDTSHSSETPVIPTTPVPPVTVAKTTDPRLESFIKDDPIYQEMLQTVDAHKVRLSLALRYALLMFGIFLVFAWIVNNRVIMFGFSEFVWLARIRDGLFGVMAGLFSATLWYGSPVWFHNMFFIMMIRIFACVFFL